MKSSETVWQKELHLWGQNNCTLENELLAEDTTPVTPNAFKRLLKNEYIHPSLRLSEKKCVIYLRLHPPGGLWKVFTDVRQVSPLYSSQPKLSFFCSSEGRSEQNSSLIIFWVLMYEALALRCVIHKILCFCCGCCCCCFSMGQRNYYSLDQDIQGKTVASERRGGLEVKIWCSLPANQSSPHSD